MNQPIIYLNEVFNEEQLEQVKAVAPNYLVKTSTDHLSLLKKRQSKLC